MQTARLPSAAAAHHYYRERDCSLPDFVAALQQRSGDAPLRFAAQIMKDIPVYECAKLAPMLDDTNSRHALYSEWIEVLAHGAGVLVLRQAYTDLAVIDEATAIFEQIILDERAAGAVAADHFAKAGANDRIWNSQEKLCVRSPEVFARYYANPWPLAVCEAWLGPALQMTAQVNVVRPGGEAQKAHRDFHLGFLTVEEAERFPAQVHTMSPYLTLQGAVAHSDMPIESGPTKLLPYSQRYAPGYLAWRRPEFREYFEAHCVQLALNKGDLLFFNPALFHAAGANRTSDVQRMANLLQASSAYGRAMESLDRTLMSELLYPVLRGSHLSATEIETAIACCAEGYAFPTNLDRDPPLGGLAPENQQALFKRALREGWESERFTAALREHAIKRLTH